MEKLVAYFMSIGFSADIAQKIAQLFKLKKLDKGDYYLRSGGIARSLAFLGEGHLQFFYIDTKGEERTTYIGLPNTFVASLSSFLNEKPAQESIRALTNTVVWVISKDDFNLLKKDIPGFKDFYVDLLEWQICCIDNGRFDLLTLTAEQRYEKFLKNEPELLQQIPLQYIASLLGITPRHLSRLRSKLPDAH